MRAVARCVACRHEKDAAGVLGQGACSAVQRIITVIRYGQTRTNPCRHEKDTAVILGKEQERLEEEAAAAAAAAQRMERVLAAVGRAAAEPLRCAPRHGCGRAACMAQPCACAPCPLPFLASRPDFEIYLKFRTCLRACLPPSSPAPWARSRGPVASCARTAPHSPSCHLPWTPVPLFPAAWARWREATASCGPSTGRSM